MTTNEEMSDFMKIVKYFEKLGLTIKAVPKKKIKNESKEQQSGFISLLLSTLGASLSRNLLTDKGVKLSNMTAEEIRQACQGTIRAGEGRIGADEETNRSEQSF